MNAGGPPLFERVYPKFVESYGFRLPDGTMNFSGSLTNIGGVRSPWPAHSWYP